MTGAEMLECGHPESEHGPATRGYGVDPTGARYCYDCCSDRDRRTIDECAGTGERVAAYVAGELRTGAELTNWPGRSVGLTVTSVGARHPNSKDRYFVRVVDARGRQWHGTAAAGMFAVLRPTVATVREASGAA